MSYDTNNIFAKILRGEIHFCIGYTEPDAGTDDKAEASR